MNSSKLLRRYTMQGSYATLADLLLAIGRKNFDKGVLADNPTLLSNTAPTPFLFVVFSCQENRWLQQPIHKHLSLFYRF